MVGDAGHPVLEGFTMTDITAVIDAAITAVDKSPAITWAGSGGARERLRAEIAAAIAREQDGPIEDCACGTTHETMPRDTDPETGESYDLVCRTHKRHEPCRFCTNEAREPLKKALRQRLDLNWEFVFAHFKYTDFKYEQFIDDLARAAFNADVAGKGYA